MGKVDKTLEATIKEIVKEKVGMGNEKKLEKLLLSLRDMREVEVVLIAIEETMKKK